MNAARVQELRAALDGAPHIPNRREVENALDHLHRILSAATNVPEVEKRHHQQQAAIDGTGLERANTQEHRDRATLLDALRAVAAERDEARAWVRKMVHDTQTLTCVYCGHAYPPGTPTHGSDVLTAHIEVCGQHPARKIRSERDAARAELAQTKQDMERLQQERIIERNQLLDRAEKAEREKEALPEGLRRRAS